MNNTEDNGYRKGWVAEPNVNLRGTSNIIYTCFFTIYACTWSALHLNIAHRGLSRFGRIFRKIQWMLIAILAPEYIALTALAQRSSTITALSDSWPLEDRSRALVFYTLMGGFELRFDDATYHRLTYSEFRGLIQAGFVDAPAITTEDIEDKSKGNWFTKSLALLQIGWFVAQLLGRVAQRLETTPLELFTLGVVACTVISYVNWWAKPLDVNTSTAMSMASSPVISKEAFFAPLEVYRLNERLTTSTSVQWFSALRAFVSQLSGATVGQPQANGNLTNQLEVGAYDDRRLPSFLVAHLQKDPYDLVELSGGPHSPRPKDLQGWKNHRDGITALRSVDRAIVHADLNQWSRRRDLLRVIRGKSRRPRPPGPRPEGFWSDALFEDRVVHTSSSVGFTLTSLVFGACHLLAWNYGFPSRPERILWQVTSICCTILPLAILIVDNGADWLRERDRKRAAACKSLQRRSRPTDHLLPTESAIINILARYLRAPISILVSAITSYISSLTLSVLYMALRVYLVVAILISLRLVPASTYSTVDWSRYVPHFG